MQRFSPTTQGIIWITLAMLMSAIADTIVRYVAMELPSYQLIFLRFGIGTLLFLPLLINKKPFSLRTSHTKLHAGRILCAFCSISLWYYAIKFLPLTTVMSLGFSSGLFVSLLAVLFLGERLERYKLLALIAGFIGMLIIIRPDIELSVYALMIVCSAIFWASSLIFLKQLSHKEDSRKLAFYFVFPLAIASAPIALAQWEAITLHQLGLITLLAIAGNQIHIYLARAFKLADLTILMPFEFSVLIFVSILAYIVFDEIITLYTLIGAIIIFVSAYAIVRREAKKHIPEEIEIIP